jgi:dTMP kinase
MFDGPDGVGKTRQVELAADRLTKQGESVYVTRAHGGTPVGEKLRLVSLSDTPRRPLTDLLLSRTIHAELAYELHIKRSLGTTCLVDRSPASMLAYQVYGSGLDADIAYPVINNDMQYFDPTLLLIYTADLAVLESRRRHRGGAGDYFEDKPADYHNRVIAGYAEAAQLYGGIIIDASGSIESVHEQTMEIIHTAGV